MNRLTTDKPVSDMGGYELAHNCCYIQNGVARYRDYDKDIDARDLARHLMAHNGFWNDYGDSPITDKELVDDEFFDEVMIEHLAFGEEDHEGLIAIFYRLIWAMADLRETLKEYEDTGTVQECREAIEKEKPKEVILIWNDPEAYNPSRNVCPSCQNTIIGNYLHCSRCPDCGQRLVWKKL